MVELLRLRCCVGPWLVDKCRTGFSITIIMRGVYLFCVDVCVGMRSEISEADLSKILPEEVEEEVRQAAEISMGTEVLHTTPCTTYICTLYVVHQGGECYVILLSVCLLKSTAKE